MWFVLYFCVGFFLQFSKEDLESDNASRISLTFVYLYDLQSQLRVCQGETQSQRNSFSSLSQSHRSPGTQARQEARALLPDQWLISPPSLWGGTACLWIQNPGPRKQRKLNPSFCRKKKSSMSSHLHLLLLPLCEKLITECFIIFHGDMLQRKSRLGIEYCGGDGGWGAGCVS